MHPHRAFIVPNLLALVLAAGCALAQTPPSKPFKQCPAIGADTSCAVVYVFNPDGSISAYVDSTQPPFGSNGGDTEDTLVGVINNSGKTQTSLTLSGVGVTGTPIFAFEGDGICKFAPFPGSSYCSGAYYQTDPGDYAGPTTTFSNISADQKTGTINFTGGLAPGASTYFSLEDEFSASAPPPAVMPPSINSLSPNSAPAGGGSFTLTITGTNFGAGATVKWTVPCSGATTTLIPTSITVTQIVVTVTSTLIATGGSAQVVVVSSASVQSNSFTFTITGGSGCGGALPAITNLQFSKSPSSSTCVAPPAVSSFLTTDVEIWTNLLVTGAQTNDVLRVDWIMPDGVTIGKTINFSPLPSAGSYCFDAWLSKASDPLAPQAGTWTARFTWNSTLLTSKTVVISSPGGGGVTINLQTVLQQLNLAPGTYTSPSVLSSVGLTIVANAPGTTPPGAAGGTGQLFVQQVGSNEVHPPGTTTEAFFFGPGIAYNVLNCTTLAWTGSGSLTGFTITRPGMINNASIPAWAMFAYDGAGNQLSTAGEGNLSTGSFLEPPNFASFTVSSFTPIARVVFCSHNGSSTYNALPLSGGSGTFGGGGPTSVTGNYTCTFGPFSSGPVTLTQNGTTVTGTLPNGGTLLGTATVTVTTITVTASWTSNFGSGTMTFTWDGTNLAGTWTRSNGNGDPGGAPATGTTGTVTGTKSTSGGGGGTVTGITLESGTYNGSSFGNIGIWTASAAAGCGAGNGGNWTLGVSQSGNANNPLLNNPDRSVSVSPGQYFLYNARFAENNALRVTLCWSDGRPNDVAVFNKGDFATVSQFTLLSGSSNISLASTGITNAQRVPSGTGLTSDGSGNDVLLLGIGGSGGGGGGGGGCTGAPTGLVACWPFDEGSGTVANDSTGNGNTGTLTNGAGWAPGIKGTALSLDGVNGYVDVGTKLKIQTSDFTLIAWIKGDPTMEQWGRILDSGFASGYALGAYGGSRQVSFEFRGSPYLTSTALVIDNTWHHVAVVKAGATATLYADGVMQNSVAVNAGAPTNMLPLYIGYNPGEGTRGHWKGQLDEVQIYGRALSPGEVLAGYTGNTPGGGGGGGTCGSPITTSLVLCLDASKLTAGPVTSWADSSGQGHNAGPAPSPNQPPVAVTNAINGLSAVQFNGVNQALQLAGGPVLTSPTYTMIALVTDETNANSSYTSYREIISDWASSSAPNSAFLGTIGFNPTRVRFSDSVGGGQQGQTGQGTITNPASPFILSGIASSSDATIYQNSTPLYSLGHATQSLVLGNTYFVGLQGTLNGEYWNGKIGELLVYNAPLSASDFSSVTTYLTNKWLGSSGGGGQPGCVYNITIQGWDQNRQDLPISFGQGGQRGNLFQVFADPKCTWTTSVPPADQNWVTHVTPSGGGAFQSGGSFDIEPNNTGAPRSTTLTIANAMVKITQSASGACSYTVDPSPPQVLGIGGGGYFGVTVSGSNCSWSVTQPPPTVTWLHLTPPTTSTTSGSVFYTVDPNQGSTPLSFTLTIVGQNPTTTLTYTVSEAAAPCFYALTPTASSPSGNSSLVLPGAPPPNPLAGNGFLMVRGSVCSWTLTIPNDPATQQPFSWIHVTSTLSGNGSSPINFTVDPNNTTQPRSVGLMIATKYPTTTLTFTVNQAPGPANTPPPPAINPGATGITNSASFIPSTLSAGSIAQGSFFSIFGSNLGPSTFVKASTYPLGTTLGNVMVKVTGSNGASVQALPVFVAASQINAIMPSNAPMGAVTITVSYNGTTSASQTATVVASSFGAFAVSGGRGPGIVQNALLDGSRPLNSSNLAAAPGDYVILWGTGLGPLSLGLGCSGASIPDQCSPDTTFKPQVSSIQVFVAGIPANMQDLYAYAARAPLISGVDQVQFPLPMNVPAGCYVPIQVVVNGTLYSNTVTLAINANRQPCVDTNPLSTLSRNGGKNGNIVLARLTYTDASSPSTSATADAGLGLFLKEQGGGSLGFDLFSSLPPLNSCTYYNNLNVFSSILGGQPVTKAGEQYLDVGPSISVASAAGGAPKVLNPANQETGYLGLFGANGAFASAAGGGLFLNPGVFTVSSNGGPDLGPFKFTLTMPSSGATWTNRDQIVVIDRTKPLTINWAGGNPATQVGIISGFSNDQDTNVSGGFTCLVSLAQGSFSVPLGMMANLPSSAGANVQSALMFLTFPSASQFVKFNVSSGPSLDNGLAYYAIGDLRNDVNFK